jgi:single-strand DNA-binding protein
MANGNVVMLEGNLTRDPELRFTPGGMAVASFGLAWNNRYQNKQTQEWEEKVSFFDVVAYGDLGENVSETHRRGDRVMVHGRLDQRSWETDEGDKRSKVEVVADSVGPSLRWATAEVTKTERDDKPARNSRPKGNSGGGRPAPRQASRPAPPQDDYDEEPF